MKRFVPFLALLLCVCLIGCGVVTVAGKKASSEVPEKMIQWEIDDYLEEFSDFGGAYTDYAVNITHDPDKETKTDTVSIDLTITYPSSIANNQWQIVYQYDKSKDTWDVLRTSGWESPKVKQYFIKESFQEWSEEYNKTGFGCDDYISGDEFIEIMEDYRLVSADQLNDGWELVGTGPDSPSQETETYVLMFKHEEDAKTLFDRLKLQLEGEDDLQQIDSEYGESVGYVKYASQGRGDYVVLVRNNTMVFWIEGYAPSRWEIIPCVDEFLARVGFVTREY